MTTRRLQEVSNDPKAPLLTIDDTSGEIKANGTSINAGGTVTSVAGRAGAVVLAEGDVTNLVADLAALNNIIKKTTVNITALQIKAMKATPIQLIASPGSGKFLGVLGWTLQYKPGAVAYTIPDVSNGFGMYGPGATGPADADLMDELAVGGSANPNLHIDALNPTLYGLNTDPAFSHSQLTSKYEDKAVLLTSTDALHNPASGEFTLGDGTLTATLYYTVVTLA